MVPAVLVLILVAIVVLGTGITLYNRLVRLRNRSENAYSDIDVQLRRRHDLVPNLVDVVAGYADHEKETLAAVIAARDHAAAASASPADRGRAEGALGKALGQVFALAEAYPTLRANENFLSLQSELSTIEDALQNARRYYNAVVRDLNNACETFPSSWIASRFGFERKEFFELETTDARAVPAVDFGS